MAQVDLFIAGRTYQIACRDGEEESLKAAARLVDAKSREALSGLGTLSESRQLLFASLLLADQLVDGSPNAAPSLPAEPEPDPIIAERAAAFAERLERLADSLENEAANA
jgi:cell division protein ZapA